jgi:uncharacterized membrane protein YhhN
VLAAAWFAVAVTVGGDWLARWRHAGRLEIVMKPAATIAIAAVGLVVVEGAPELAVGAMIVGFACCLAGDIALLPAIDRFVVGLASFLVGHVAFVVMFLALGLDDEALGGVALVLMTVVGGTLGVRIVRGARQRNAALRAPVTAYLAVISLMTIAGWSTGLAASIVGAALFVTSDTILGWRTFVAERVWMPLAVMVTYHGALIGLALSLA